MFCVLINQSFLFLTHKGIMASHKSAEKSIRKNVKQRRVNVSRVSRIRTFIRKVEQAISDKLEKSVIISSFSKAQSEIMKGVKSNIMHKNTASRKISRISKRVKSATGEVKA